MSLWIQSPDIEMLDEPELEGNTCTKKMNVPPKRPFGKPMDFIKEHLRLIKVLQSGTKKQQSKEAKKQAQELKEMLKKNESRK